MNHFETTASAEVFLEPHEASVSLKDKGPGLLSMQVRSDGVNMTVLLEPEQVERLTSELENGRGE